MRGDAQNMLTDQRLVTTGGVFLPLLNNNSLQSQEFQGGKQGCKLGLQWALTQAIIHMSKTSSCPGKGGSLEFYLHTTQGPRPKAPLTMSIHVHTMAPSSLIVVHIEKLLDSHNIVILLSFEAEPFFLSAHFHLEN